MSDLAQDAFTYRGTLRACKRCELHKVGKGPVPWSGGISRDLVCLGEAPGRLEDQHGEPFIGPAGNLLHSLLRGCGVDPREVGFVNAVSCYPARTPTIEEVGACSSHMATQLALLQPKFVLSFGVVALEALFPHRELKLGEVRGRPIWTQKIANAWPVHWGIAVEVWPTYHPAAALRNSNYRNKITEDLQRFVEWRNGNLPYPFHCVRCGKEAERFDENGLAWCAGHASRQLRLPVVS